MRAIRIDVESSRARHRAALAARIVAASQSDWRASMCSDGAPRGHASADIEIGLCDNGHAPRVSQQRDLPWSTR